LTVKHWPSVLKALKSLKKSTKGKYSQSITLQQACQTQTAVWAAKSVSIAKIC
jgi:hypothetical protein